RRRLCRAARRRPAGEVRDRRRRLVAPAGAQRHRPRARPQPARRADDRPLSTGGYAVGVADYPSPIDADTPAKDLRRPAPPEGGPYTPRSGRPDYHREHIPGAVFADLIGELADPEVRFPFWLPSDERAAAAFGALGIGPGTHVVAYAQDNPMWATRLWWLLRYFGFDDVSVLDGGLPAWRAAGRPLSAQP